MEFNDYQKIASTLAMYPNKGKNFVYPTLGLTGEAGEVAEKIKKVLRDHEGIIDSVRKDDIQKELGDVLWYLAALAGEVGLTLQEVADANIEKLVSRKERNVLSGSGDNR